MGDARLLQSLQKPKESFTWRTYLFITLLLGAPVLLPGLIFWLFILITEYVFISNHVWGVVIIISLVGLGSLVYLLLTRSHLENDDNVLDRSTAPQLFEVLDEVADYFHAPHIERVYLDLNANASVKQDLKWWPRPYFETRLNLGLLACYALNVTELKSVLAHEIGHIKGRDTVWMWFISKTIQTLQDWRQNAQVTMRAVSSAPNILGPFLLIGALIANWLINLYLNLLIKTHLRSMRRQEYLADRGAATAYGRATLLQAIVTIAAVDLKFHQYLPVMVQRFDNNLECHDFYFQFVNLWEKMDDEIKSSYYARVIASFRSVYDTHPSYKDRRKALEQVNCPILFEDTRSAAELLPDASEEGRKLTIQLLQRRLNRR